MEEHTLKNVNNSLNTNIYSYLETSGGQSSNLCLNVIFSTPVLIRHLWQIKTVILLHWYLIRGVPLYKTNQVSQEQRQIEDVEVVDEAVVAQEAAGPSNFRNLQIFGQLVRQRVHRDGQDNDEQRQAPGPQGVPENQDYLHLNLTLKIGW